MDLLKILEECNRVEKQNKPRGKVVRRKGYAIQSRDWCWQGHIKKQRPYMLKAIGTQ